MKSFSLRRTINHKTFLTRYYVDGCRVAKDTYDKLNSASNRRDCFGQGETAKGHTYLTHEVYI